MERRETWLISQCWLLLALGACTNDPIAPSAQPSMIGAGRPALQTPTSAQPAASPPLASASPAAAPASVAPLPAVSSSQAGAGVAANSGQAGSAPGMARGGAPAAIGGSGPAAHGGSGGRGGLGSTPSQTAAGAQSADPDEAPPPNLSDLFPPPSSPDNRPASPNNPAECPMVAPENPVGDCLGLPIYVECVYGTYVCVCDWYHWLCAG